MPPIRSYEEFEEMEAQDNALRELRARFPREFGRKLGLAERWRAFWRKSFWFVSVLMALGCVGIALGLPWLFRLFGW